VLKISQELLVQKEVSSDHSHNLMATLESLDMSAPCRAQKMAPELSRKSSSNAVRRSRASQVVFVAGRKVTSERYRPWHNPLIAFPNAHVFGLVENSLLRLAEPGSVQGFAHSRTVLAAPSDTCSFGSSFWRESRQVT